MEDDLRRIFSVYGPLDFKILKKSRLDDTRLKIRYNIKGLKFEFQGTMLIQFSSTPQGPLITSGLFTDMRAVLKVLRQRRLGLEQGSIDMLDSIISMDYKPKHGNRQEFISKLHETLSLQGRIGIVVENLKISIDNNTAKVVQSVLKLEIGEDKTLENRADEKIVLHKEGTRWRIWQGLD